MFAGKVFRSIIQGVLFMVSFFIANTGIVYLSNDNSFYIPNVVIYCKSERECRHEVGHLMDHDLGDKSKSHEFGESVWIYLYLQDTFGGSKLIRDTIISEPGLFYYSDLYSPMKLEQFSSPQQELYAQLYANVNGDISQLSTLSRFYATDPKYEEIYQYLIVHKVIFFK